MRRILVWGLSNRLSGTETVIVNYASRAHDVAFDFVCYEAPEKYRHELFGEDSPNRFFVFPMKIQHPFAYRRALRSFMAEHGAEYDALWLNLNDAANIDVLVRAERAGIRKRVVHVHNSHVEDRLITKIATALQKDRCARLATRRIACSKSAGDFLFAGHEFSVVPNKADATRVAFNVAKREEVRRRHGLGDELVVGFMGRLSHQKNPGFLVGLMPRLLERDGNVRLMIVGEGELETDLREQAKRLGVAEQTVFAGAQDDAQAYYSAFDVFALPSRYEGLSLAVLEAQFNGLACVLSDAMDADCVITDAAKLVTCVDTDAWASALLAAPCRDRVRYLERAGDFDWAHDDAGIHGLLGL